MGLTIRITKNDLAAYSSRGVVAAESAALDACEEGAGVARSMAPRDTGELASSISAEKDGDHARIVAAAPYALFQEVGTSRGVQGKRFVTEGIRAAADAWPGKIRIT